MTSKKPLWRIYYRDGTTHDDSTQFKDIPKFGVITTVYNDGISGLCAIHYSDYYILHANNRWTGHCLSGLIQSLAFDLSDIKLVVFGMYVDDETHAAVYGRAIRDADFNVAPVK